MPKQEKRVNASRIPFEEQGVAFNFISTCENMPEASLGLLAVVLR